MKKTNPLFQEQLEAITSKLMDEFLIWNNIQKELSEKGYEHNHYNEAEIAQERMAFLAIAERLLLEDMPCEKWKWLETPWAGTDGNTGMDACVIDFLVSDAEEADLGIISFYVAKNSRFWYAIPLAEAIDNEGSMGVYEVNCVQDALNAWKLPRLTTEEFLT